ncbi:hypothetical protein TCAL_01406 [Tigriopus californicus]|uniref:DUF1308 domain-containing protein n=1 Tax=Tigriopus californicus TaxID=6832 RepID=A0A553NSC6_TIGCA|nr:UPF0415 protein C7orf25 homolog [Tigriopus californicus]TRY68341.1 hypothetical protein TCAL_01406 [Tigriopus californicus]|eukprot:TCALIF_01406-PA protein Name:"Similar to C7orf25 UPF0415 protein C7orf25 (Homo sapiens)" AED:0.45 eAED:0.45 QI:0/-1/0/1/-1/1/1/0/432
MALPAHPEELMAQLNQKCAQGDRLLATLHSPDLAGVTGLAKLEKKIRQELKFLRKFTQNGPGGPGRGTLKREHLQCSNLQNLAAIVEVLQTTGPVVAVLQPFNVLTEGRERKVTVDIVADQGLRWIKVVARNPKSLDQNSDGAGQFGQRTLMDQVREFVRGSRQNRKLFQVPIVHFMFRHGVSDVLARQLERKGVRVSGTILPRDPSDPRLGELEDASSSESDSSQDEADSSDETPSSSEDERSVASKPGNQLSCEAGFDPHTLNLDITAMIAYVSALTNGHAHYRFKEKILTEQALWERARPARAHLDQIFGDKALICCQSAMTDFQTIIGTLGGPGERARSQALLARVSTVPDQMTDRVKVLDVSGKIKERSQAIFGTGDRLRVATVSANSGFVRAAKGQGVDLAVILHESRALTEDKMKTAKPITDHED